METTNQKHLELIDDMSFNNEIFKKFKKEEKENNKFFEYLEKMKNMFLSQFLQKQKIKACLGIENIKLKNDYYLLKKYVFIIFILNNYLFIKN